MALAWGVIPLLIPQSDTIDDLIRFSIQAARKAGHLNSGQHVVITGGVPLYVAGNTNFIKVEKVE
jgi:pyruvate kinase